MQGESARKLISKAPSSNNYLNDQLIEEMIGAECALQLDEVNDSNKDAHFICYIPFLDDNIIVEDLLSAESSLEEQRLKI